MKKLGYIFVFFISGICLTAQTNVAWQVATKDEVVASYQKACNWFTNTNSYNFHLNYTSYKDHNSNDIVETSKGFYKRNANKYRSEVIGIKTIQNEKARIIIDTNDKLIAITDPGTLNPTMADTKQLLELLKNVKALKKKKTEKQTIYKIDFLKNQMYESYEFAVGEKGIIEKLVYFYSEQTDKDYGGDEDDGHDGIEQKIKPRLEIVFGKWEIPAKVSESDFNDKGIVFANNKKVTLSDKYKQYQVKDYRTTGKN